MSDKLEKIKEKLKREVAGLAEKYHFDFLIVYGSYARDKERANSDIDLGVSGAITFRQEMELAVELHRILGTSHLDVINLDRVSPLLARLASSQATLIYEREPGCLANFRTGAFKKFVETQPLRDLNFARTASYIRQFSSIL